MWEGHVWSFWLYHVAIVSEWVDGRGYKDTCLDKFEAIMNENLPLDEYENAGAPPWLGNEAFHLSHQSNLIRKDPIHYAPQFPGVPNDLEYVWPV